MYKYMRMLWYMLAVLATIFLCICTYKSYKYRLLVVFASLVWLEDNMCKTSHSWLCQTEAHQTCQWNRHHLCHFQSQCTIVHSEWQSQKPISFFWQREITCWCAHWYRYDMTQMWYNMTTWLKFSVYVAGDFCNHQGRLFAIPQALLPTAGVPCWPQFCTLDLNGYQDDLMELIGNGKLAQLEDNGSKSSDFSLRGWEVNHQRVHSLKPWPVCRSFHYRLVPVAWS